MTERLKCIFLIPIGSGINGKLIPQFLKLQSWCDKNNSEILTITGRPHNFARNYLATGGKGFVDPTPPNAEWLIWIDSDIIFNINQIELLLKHNHQFCAGWYINDLSNQIMAGYMDEDFFNKHGRMPFLNKNWLSTQQDEVNVDFTGFGFVKIHYSLLEKMTYPYFTLNIQKYGDYQDLSSEDVSFCLNCYKETGIKPVILPILKVGHLKSVIL